MRIRVSEDTMNMSSLNLNPEQLAPQRTNRVDFLKRGFDIIVSAIALIFLFPVILLFAILVRSQDGGNAIFAQSRYGLNGNTFKCYKLRSMSSNASAQLEEMLASCPAIRQEWQATQKLRNDPRITPLGKFLRKSSIDELPQLWNVLKGDMSIVGPRPIVKNEIQKYGEHYRLYTSVRPGLTGLWQVEGRTDTTYRERVEMDVRYVLNRTFLTDIWIILKTIPAVLASRGAV